MASALRLRSILSSRLAVPVWSNVSSVRCYCSAEKEGAVVTHTGQKFDVQDYRNLRFEGYEKQVNPSWAQELIAEEPIIVCVQRAVFSDGGGALGHPRVYINLDQPEVQVCGYSGRRFIQKQFYNEAEHGPSISYEEFMDEMNPQKKQWPQ